MQNCDLFPVGRPRTPGLPHFRNRKQRALLSSRDGFTATIRSGLLTKAATGRSTMVVLLSPEERPGSEEPEARPWDSNPS